MAVKRLSAALLIALLALPASQARSEDNALEYKVKATFLYKFGAFVDWPQSVFPSAASAISVCVAGRDPFDGILDKVVEGQHIADRPVVARHLKTVTRDTGCQILYIGGSDDQSVVQALEIVRGTGVLTVTDAEQGNAAGIVHFVNDDNHIRFSIDENAASRDGLMISSKLLSLAISSKRKS